MGLVNDVEMGVERTDDRYILDGSNEEVNALFRREEAEAALEVIFSSCGFRSVELKNGRWYGEATMGSALNMAGLTGCLSALAKLAALSSRKQVRVRGQSDRQSFAFVNNGKESSCPGCGEALDLDADEIRSCEQCSTVQHASCFEALDGCSVPGCHG